MAETRLIAEPTTKDERAHNAQAIAAWWKKARTATGSFPTRKASEHWLFTQDADISGATLYRYHYSSKGRYNANRLFVGPGQKLVLLETEGMALFAWRKFIDDSGQTGVCCATFANYGRVQSSLLIQEAEKIAWERWPGERLYTFVDPSKIRSKVPGACFRAAGWKSCGSTPKGLLVLEKTP